MHRALVWNSGGLSSSYVCARAWRSIWYRRCIPFPCRRPCSSLFWLSHCRTMLSCPLVPNVHARTGISCRSGNFCSRSSSCRVQFWTFWHRFLAQLHFHLPRYLELLQMEQTLIVKAVLGQTQRARNYSRSERMDSSQFRQWKDSRMFVDLPVK